MADEDDEDEEVERRTGPRALWTGTITFGLVSIPVELYPAVRSTTQRLHMVDEEGNPLRRRYFCPRHDDAALEAEEIARGYAVDDATFALVTDEELQALAPDKSRRIELLQFVQHDEIDPRYVRTAYFVAPAGDATQPYHLLARTMEETDRVGIATFVMRGHAYVVAIRAEDGLLRAETLRYPDEIKSPEDVGIDEAEEGDEDEVARIEEAIEELAADEIDPDELVDPAIARIRKLVARKRKADEDVVTPEEPLAETRAAVLDLMAVLKDRLSGGEAEEAPAAQKKAGKAGKRRRRSG